MPNFCFLLRKQSHADSNSRYGKLYTFWVQQGRKLYGQVVCVARMPSAVLPKLHRIPFGGCRPDIICQRFDCMVLYCTAH